MQDLLNRLENNCFIYDVRLNLTFNAAAYGELIALLQEIKLRTRHKKEINKRLASSLYEIPKLVWIWHLNLKNDPNRQDKEIVQELEDAWFELDALICEQILAADWEGAFRISGSLKLPETFAKSLSLAYFFVLRHDVG